MSFTTTIEPRNTSTDEITNLAIVHLNSLPDEVLLNILSCLSHNELHGTAAKVCKKWLQLSRDPSLMKKVALKGDSFGKTEYLLDMLSGAFMLEDLKIRCRDDAAVLVQTVSQYSGKRLVRLQINYCPALTEECTAILARNCLNLKSINLDGTGTNSDLATGNLMQLKMLRNIDLFNCKYVLPEHVIDLATNCDFLEKINLGEVTHLNDDCIEILLQTRKNTLKVLVLDGEHLSEKAFCNLSHCNQLEELNLSFAETLGALVLKEISKLKTLKRLRYSRGKLLTRKDFCAAFSSNSLSGLVHIDFSECIGFDDESIISVANTCSHLEKITVDWCENLTDEGMIFLIRKCQQLHYLKLVGLFNITDAVLCNLIQLLPNLKYLNLIQCPNITDDILHAMCLDNMNLDILDYYGNQVQKSEDIDELIFS